jgi:hypothetical protein
MSDFDAFQTGGQAHSNYQLKTEDNRPLLHRIRRKGLQNLARDWGLDVPPGATHEFLVAKMAPMVAAGVDILHPPAKPPKPIKDRTVDMSRFIDLSVMNQPQLRKLCRTRGIPTQKTDKRDVLIGRLNGSDPT